MHASYIVYVAQQYNNTGYIYQVLVLIGCETTARNKNEVKRKQHTEKMRGRWGSNPQLEMLTERKLPVKIQITSTHFDHLAHDGI